MMNQRVILDTTQKLKRHVFINLFVEENRNSPDVDNQNKSRSQNKLQRTSRCLIEQ